MKIGQENMLMNTEGPDFREYLRELAVEDDDVRQNAYEEARENYDYDDWIQ